MLTPLYLIKAVALSLALTEAIELTAAALCGFRGKRLTLVLLVNIITNPAVVSLYLLAVHSLSIPPILPVLLLEPAAVVVEALFYRRAGISRPFIFSLAFNAVSYGAGLLLNTIM